MTAARSTRSLHDRALYANRRGPVVPCVLELPAVAPAAARPRTGRLGSRRRGVDSRKGTTLLDGMAQRVVPQRIFEIAYAKCECVGGVARARPERKRAAA